MSRRTVLAALVLALALRGSVVARPPLESPSSSELRGPLVWEPLLRGWMEGSPTGDVRVALLGDADDVRRHLLDGGRPHLAGVPDALSPEALVRALTGDGTGACRLLLVTFPRPMEPTLTLTKAYDDGNLQVDVDLSSPHLPDASPDRGFAVVALAPHTRQVRVALSVVTDGALTGRLFAARHFRGTTAPIIDAASRMRALLRSPALPSGAADRVRARMAAAREELERGLRILEPFESGSDEGRPELPFLVLARGTAPAGAVPDPPALMTDAASLRSTCRLLGLGSVPDVDLELVTVVAAGGPAPLVPRRLLGGAPGEPVELLLTAGTPDLPLRPGQAAWVLIRIPRPAGPLRVVMGD